MRNAALLPLLCVAGIASAAPATDAAVADVLRTLGKESMWVSAVEAMVAEVPSLNGLPQSDRQCAHSAMQAVVLGNARQSVINHLGDDGDSVVAEWARFLETPSGKGYLALEGVLTETDVEPVDVNSETYQTDFEAFMASAAYRRLLASFGRMAMPGDLPEQLARGLQDQCRIALNPEEIS
ncbi:MULTISPECIES: hypothetical protein [Stenotrophomonas]|uniref:hypothetical protein n=1 Tax=Stenotrophomonas TaxID=40323 RepID=UPI000D53D175|nr:MULTISPECIES: hypothetical protein [Stenotrophomonas]AWH21346.1 hypothetical protein C1933_09020 [Stenotrophomonas sp. ZAC14D2_NAIMI4_6]